MPSQEDEKKESHQENMGIKNDQESEGLLIQGLLASYDRLTPDFLSLSDISANMIGQTINLQATVGTARRQGSIAFLELIGDGRPNDSLQVIILTPQGEPRETFKQLELKKGTIIRLRGILRTRESKNIIDSTEKNAFAEIELSVNPSEIHVEIQPQKKDSALTWKNLVESGLVTTEFYGEILRMPEFLRVQKLREKVSRIFLDHFTSKGFTEITVPALTQSISESGAEVFKVRGRSSELALNQSPQQVKQIMAAVFGKVVSRGQFFRDDPSFTAHHLAEFSGLDIEMILRYSNKERAMRDVMNELEEVVKRMVNEMQNHKRSLAENGADLPTIPNKGIPVVPFTNAMALAVKVQPELTDFNRTAEGIVAESVRHATGSDFYFITGFPDDDKPFYTDIASDQTSYSFDLIYRGVEIASGGLRINDPELLRRRLLEKGFSDLEQFKDYFDNFERGTAQTGGFGLGLERFLANSLGGINVRLTTLFPKTAKSAIG